MNLPARSEARRRAPATPASASPRPASPRSASTSPVSPRRRGPALGAVAVSALLLGIATSCGGGEAESLSPAAERGREIAKAKGCAGCHGDKGQGGVGPQWIDLHGSQVELVDGSFVVADDAYLIRSIVDPNAEVVAGYVVQMPANDLAEPEVADVVAYIKELGSHSGEG